MAAARRNFVFQKQALSVGLFEKLIEAGYGKSEDDVK
jgi:hypothetical protein